MRLTLHWATTQELQGRDEQLAIRTERCKILANELHDLKQQQAKSEAGAKDKGASPWRMSETMAKELAEVNAKHDQMCKEQVRTHQCNHFALDICRHSQELGV